MLALALLSCCCASGVQSSWAAEYVFLRARASRTECSKEGVRLKMWWLLVVACS